MLRCAKLVLVLIALGASQLPAQGAARREVVAARHPSAGVAAYHGDRGLVLRAPVRPELVLGTAADARFGAAGDLWFVRSVDQGHHELARSWWVLPRGAAAPRPARADEVPPAPAAAAAPESVAVKVCLDPGHGGSDPGALGNGLRETDINLDVVLRLRDFMVLDSQDPTRGGHWDLLLTRSSDVDVSLGQRTSAANAFGADSFVSVHMNAFSSASANGTETFSFTGTQSGASGRLRGEVHSEALRAWNRTDRGVKTANFFVLRNTNMPAILLEGGFLTNAGDAAVMADPARREDLALGVLFALQRFHGFTPWDPRSGGGEALRGTVLDFGGQPVAGALVSTTGGQFAFSDARGAWAIDTAETGIVHVGATAAGFDAVWSVTFLVAGQPGTVNLRMAAADVPRLALSPVDPGPGVPFVVQAVADPGSPVVLVLNVVPRLPTLDLRRLGLGVAWPELTGSVAVPVGSAGGSGLLVAFVQTPAVPGLALQAQAVVTRNGALRLSNGAALRVR
jgi:N-acetylmuramoyl-L-alanine amidase